MLAWDDTNAVLFPDTAEIRAKNKKRPRMTILMLLIVNTTASDEGCRSGAK